MRNLVSIGSPTLRRRDSGMTVAEMLVALAVLGIVLVLTSSGIVQSLVVNRAQEEATNTQSKLRRVTEVIAQELRAAVLGGITHYPIASGSQAISFALLGGDGGVTVLPRPGNSWGNVSNTLVHAPDPSVLLDMVGHPAVMINGNGEALVIPEITLVPGSNDRVNHNGCKISINYEPPTRLYSASALAFRYVPEDKTLYQVVLDSDGMRSVPFAFGLSDFQIAYEYASVSDRVVRSTPYTDANGNAQPTYLSDGAVYELSRLRLTLTTEDEPGSAAREYVTYIELTGLGNSSRPINDIQVCDDRGGGSGGNWGGPEEPGNGNGAATTVAVTAVTGAVAATEGATVAVTAVTGAVATAGGATVVATAAALAGARGWDADAA